MSSVDGGMPTFLATPSKIVLRPRTMDDWMVAKDRKSVV